MITKWRAFGLSQSREVLDEPPYLLPQVAHRRKLRAYNLFFSKQIRSWPDVAHEYMEEELRSNVPQKHLRVHRWVPMA